MEILSLLLEGFAGIPQAPLPEALASRLRDYQRRGVNWLVFLRDAGLGALLADDMGLGKTLQVLTKMVTSEQLHLALNHSAVLKMAPMPLLNLFLKIF